MRNVSFLLTADGVARRRDGVLAPYAPGWLRAFASCVGLVAVRDAGRCSPYRPQAVTTPIGGQGAARRSGPPPRERREEFVARRATGDSDAVVVTQFRLCPAAVRAGAMARLARQREGFGWSRPEP